MQPHRGTLILVLGILSIVLCQPLGFFAWVMGNNDLKSMDLGAMDPEGRSTTKAGQICGIIGSVLFIVSLVMMIFFFLMAGALAVGGAAAGTP